MTKTANKLNANAKLSTAISKTKKSQLIEMLGTKAGADIKTLSEQLGWQQHTSGRR